MAATLGAVGASHEEGGFMPSVSSDNVRSAEELNNKPSESIKCKDDSRSEPEIIRSARQPPNYCKSEFNKGRKILIKNIPAGATSEDVKEFLKDFEVKSIDYDDLSQQAVVILEHGEEAETIVQTLNNCPLLDTEVSVSLCPSDRMLCVAHLPNQYTDDQLRTLATAYGQIRWTFLMRCPKTGRSKGYGFVEYSESVDRIQEIVLQLDWTVVEGHRLHVELIEENLQTWSRLQSRCILIDNLPWDFTDTSKLREIFSCVTSPVYCQIAVKDGKSLGYGIIEFRQPSEAEATWDKLSDEQIQNQPISLSFCIPGRPAVVIYNRIMWKMDSKLEPSSKSSLLPDPLFVSPALLSSPLVKGLTTQFPQLIPVFMKSLQQLHQSYISSVLSRNTKPGLLGPAPYPPISPIMNPNMQLGLIIFIVLQLQAKFQQQFTGPLARQLNLLGQYTEAQELKYKANGICHLQMALVFFVFNKSYRRKKHNGYPKPSLLDEPVTVRANMLLQNLLVQLRTPMASNQSDKSDNNQPPISTQADLPITADPKAALFYQQHLQNVKYLNLNLLMNLGQVMFSMQNQKPDSSDQPGQTQTAILQPSSHTREGLLPNPSLPAIRNGPVVTSLRPSPPDYAGGNHVKKNLTMSDPFPKLANSDLPVFPVGQSTDCAGKTSLLGEPPGCRGTQMKDQNCYSRNLKTSQTLFKQTFSGEGDFWIGSSGSCDDSGYVEPTEYIQQRKFPETVPQCSDPTSMTFSGGGLLPTPIGVSTAYHPPSQNKTVLRTPVGQKRGYSSLLPEPEPSPEGDFIIGQHSQGIGGHYAETYRKRQKLDHRY